MRCAKAGEEQTDDPVPVLLIGAEEDCRPAAEALAHAGVAQIRCASPARAPAACASPRAIVLCAQILTREHPRQMRLLTQSFPQAPVIALTARLERWELRAMLAAGAAGVLLTDESLSQRILPCLQAAISGQLCAPLQLGSQVAPPALSAREKQILGLVVMGYMNCQIAERLFLAESTVKSHLSSAFGKLGVRSRNEAASLILDPEHGRGMGILTISDQPRALEPAGLR